MLMLMRLMNVEVEVEVEVDAFFSLLLNFVYYVIKFQYHGSGRRIPLPFIFSRTTDTLHSILSISKNEWTSSSVLARILPRGHSWAPAPETTKTQSASIIMSKREAPADLEGPRKRIIDHTLTSVERHKHC